MATASAKFEDALTKFRQTLTVKQRANIEKTTLQDIHQTIEDVQQRQDKSRTLKNLTRIESFVSGMEELGKIIELFANVNSIVAYVWVKVQSIAIILVYLTTARE